MKKEPRYLTGDPTPRLKDTAWEEYMDEVKNPTHPGVGIVLGVGVVLFVMGICGAIYVALKYM